MIGPDFLTSRRTWIVVGAAWIVAFAALGAWLARTPLEILREQLKSLQFWSLETCIVLGLGTGAVVFRDLRRELDRSDGLRMLGLAVFAVGLTVLVAPRTSRIYYDEQIYQGIGQNLADLKLAQMCNDGAVEYGRLQCLAGEYNKQPYAYPHLLSLAYRVVGVDAAIAFAINTLAMALTVCAVYLVVLFLFTDRVAAFFGGLLVALTPQQIIWSATAAVEPSASLACVVALLSAIWFIRSRDTLALVATGVAAAYSVQFRPESLLMVVVLAGLLWLRAPDELTRPRLWWVGALFFALVAVHVAHMFAVRHEGWGTTETRLSLRYVADNFRVNGAFYLGDDRFPAVFTLLAGIGLVSRRFVSERITIVLYFLLFFGIYLVFYAGSYNYGADVRYSLMTFPPIAILGGLGCARMVGWLRQSTSGLPSQTVVAAALAFQFLWYAPLVRATTEEAWAARADVRFAESLVPLLQGNSYVLTHNPGMFHVWGVNAGQMSLVFNNPSYLDYLVSRYTAGVYVHWNFWCNVQVPLQQEFCRKSLSLKPAVVVREYRERDQRYALYRFDGGRSQ